MNRAILQERLTRLIAQFAKDAMEARQIAKRLRSLLPLRFREIKSEHARRGRGAHAERQALADPRYMAFLEEFANINAAASKARIQYETYMMLFEARRSLRTMLR